MCFFSGEGWPPGVRTRIPLPTRAPSSWNPQPWMDKLVSDADEGHSVWLLDGGVSRGCCTSQIVEKKEMNECQMWFVNIGEIETFLIKKFNELNVANEISDVFFLLDLILKNVTDAILTDIFDENQILNFQLHLIRQAPSDWRSKQDWFLLLLKLLGRMLESKTCPHILQQSINLFEYMDANVMDQLANDLNMIGQSLSKKPHNLLDIVGLYIKEP